MTTHHQQHLLKRLLIWRVKHISDRRFILILSGIIGIATGLAALAISSLKLLLIVFTLSSQC